MSEPDFDRLQKINLELAELVRNGRMTRAEFDRLFEQASAAVGEHTEFLEGILMRGAELGYVTLDEDEGPESEDPSPSP